MKALHNGILEYLWKLDKICYSASDIKNVMVFDHGVHVDMTDGNEYTISGASWFKLYLAIDSYRNLPKYYDRLLKVLRLRYRNDVHLHRTFKSAQITSVSIDDDRIGIWYETRGTGAIGTAEYTTEGIEFNADENFIGLLDWLVKKS